MSVVSVWELQIEITLGKFSLTPTLAEVVENARTKDGLQLIGLETAHVYALDALPMLHKDPFDRVIIASAIVEGATLLSADGAVAAYAPAVNVMWQNTD